MADPDQEICLCFHVSRRKIENWVRIEKPQKPGQLGDCGGAGTGCGWCRPVLERIFAAVRRGESSVECDPEQHAAGRKEYLRSQRSGGPLRQNPGELTEET